MKRICYYAVPDSYEFDSIGEPSDQLGYLEAECESSDSYEECRSWLQHSDPGHSTIIRVEYEIFVRQVRRTQMDKVDCSRGAPMGRSPLFDGYEEASKSDDVTIAVFEVDINEGYDDGGAYWGESVGFPVWFLRVWNSDEALLMEASLRASSREKAIEEFKQQYGALPWATHPEPMDSAWFDGGGPFPPEEPVGDDLRW